MDFEQVAQAVKGVPHMSRTAGRRLFDHVTGNDLRDVLEIGTSHGVSTCYLAAAVHELDDGRVVTLDRKAAIDLDPNVDDLLSRTGLGGFVTPIFA
jgi:predicted O-methyltransferase YrrM